MGRGGEKLNEEDLLVLDFVFGEAKGEGGGAAGAGRKGMDPKTALFLSKKMRRRWLLPGWVCVATLMAAARAFAEGGRERRRHPQSPPRREKGERQGDGEFVRGLSDY